jgi:ribosomal protein S18 acetylase RimI-like enzyme
MEDKETCLEIFHGNVPDYFAANELSDVSYLLEALPCPYLVIENDDGKVVASGGIWFDPSECAATLCWVMVERKLHGKGFGRLMVLRLLTLLQHRPSITLVKLDTSQHITGFYEKLGFEKSSFMENYYAENLHRYDMKLDWNAAKLKEVLERLRVSASAKERERNS